MPSVSIEYDVDRALPDAFAREVQERVGDAIHAAIALGLDELPEHGLEVVVTVRPAALERAAG